MLVNPNGWREQRNLSESLDLIKQGQVESVEVAGDILKLDLKDGTKIQTRKEYNQSFYELLKEVDYPSDQIKNITVADPSLGGRWLDLLINGLPIIFMIIFFVLIFRQAKGGAGDIFSMGRSRAKLFQNDGKKPAITFADVAGLAEAKQELNEIVDFLSNPLKYHKLGARIPRGVLLVGPSGVGKTLLAKAVAGEAKVSFFSMAGSEFMEMLVGVGASRVRDLFKVAKEKSPAIIFIDEIDAIGRQRESGFAGGHGEREQTLNQILVEMDGFDARVNVIVMAATNRPDILDPALVRPGRFDRRVTLEMPDIEEREEIIRLHMHGKPFTPEVVVKSVAQRTVGFSGADLENMLNEAAILAARNAQKAITPDDLEEAATKVKMGPERKRLQSAEDKRMTACHEAGHALVASFLDKMDPVHRISIVARGLSLGHTMFPPTKDRYNETRTRLLQMISTALGGRAAEELVFDELTIGASNDIQKASEIARKMVTEYGMGADGPVGLVPDLAESWLELQVNGRREISQETLAKVDVEVRQIVTDCYQKAKDII
ncbi:cell division protein FtsH, partial [candidate division WWE3 bacterium CG08_land_8_20_14_0_20_43_13]